MTPEPFSPAGGPMPIDAAAVIVSRDTRLMEAAQSLEAGFLAEMLKSAGLGEQKSEFGGGLGEEQFSSFLRQAQAEEMAQRGGIGLAEALFEAMKARADG